MEIAVAVPHQKPTLDQVTGSSMRESSVDSDTPQVGLFDCELDEPVDTAATRTEMIWLADGIEVEIEAASVQVWGSARLLSTWLLTDTGRSIVQGRRILELGAALGLPSIASAIAGAERAIATDLCRGALDALQRLLSIRYKDETWASRVQAAQLDWGDCQHADFEVFLEKADVVIAADCHYYSRALRPLIAAIQCHICRGGLLLLASREGRVSLDESRALLLHEGFTEESRMPLISHKLQLGLEGDHFVTLYRAPS